jgi:phage/plasmid-associated DNA primase
VGNQPVFGVGEELTDVAGAPYWRYRLILAGNATSNVGRAEATTGYRTEQDVLGNYVAECCHTGPAYTGERARVLYDAYQAWCEATGKPRASQHRFGKALKGQGFKSRPSNGTVYDGIQVKPAWREMVEARDRRRPDAKRDQDSS